MDGYVKIPGYRGRYLINTEGKVFDTKDQRFIDVAYDECIDAMRVYLNRKRKNLAKVMLKVFKNKKVASNEMVLFKDGDESNVFIENLGVTRRKRKKAHLGPLHL